MKDLTVGKLGIENPNFVPYKNRLPNNLRLPKYKSFGFFVWHFFYR